MFCHIKSQFIDDARVPNGHSTEVPNTDGRTHRGLQKRILIQYRADNSHSRTDTHTDNHSRRHTGLEAAEQGLPVAS